MYFNDCKIKCTSLSSNEKVLTDNIVYDEMMLFTEYVWSCRQDQSYSKDVPEILNINSVNIRYNALYATQIVGEVTYKDSSENF